MQIKQKSNIQRRKIELYEYINLNDFTFYFNNIERTAEKINEFSFRVLIKDFDNNIIYNENILNFKNDINKILIQMQEYYENGFISMVERLHQKCLNNFYELIKNEINKLIIKQDYKYYLFLKQELYKNLVLMSDSYKKSKKNDINEKQMSALDIFIKQVMKDYIFKKNVLKKYICSYKEQLHYDDLLYINLNNIDEVNDVLQFFENNNRIYKKITLPQNIVIKEINKNVINCYKYLYNWSDIIGEYIIKSNIFNKVLTINYIKLYYIFEKNKISYINNKYIINNLDFFKIINIFKNNIYCYFIVKITYLNYNFFYIMFYKKGIGTMISLNYISLNYYKKD